MKHANPKPSNVKHLAMKHSTLRISITSFLLALIVGSSGFFAWTALTEPVVRKRDLLGQWALGIPLALIATSAFIGFIVYIIKATRLVDEIEEFSDGNEYAAS